jgi:large subunit ribosomal protein L13
MAKDLSSMANNNKSYMAKPGEVESKWYIVDATDMVLGRLASQVASILRGKNKPEYTPNVLCGDHVIVVNCEKVRLTGKKLEQKYYRYHTGYVGGLKEVQYKKLMNEKPDFAVLKAVKGMLPKNSLGRDMLTNLRVYVGSEHNHQAQCPVELKLN